MILHRNLRFTLTIDTIYFMDILWYITGYTWDSDSQSGFTIMMTFDTIILIINLALQLKLFVLRFRYNLYWESLRP